LEEEFSEEEIHAVVKELKSDKALDPMALLGFSINPAGVLSKRT